MIPTHFLHDSVKRDEFEVIASKAAKKPCTEDFARLFRLKGLRDDVATAVAECCAPLERADVRNLIAALARRPDLIADLEAGSLTAAAFVAATDFLAWEVGRYPNP